MVFGRRQCSVCVHVCVCVCVYRTSRGPENGNPVVKVTSKLRAQGITHNTLPIFTATFVAYMKYIQSMRNILCELPEKYEEYEGDQVDVIN